ncbi:MAG: DDE-type integrase/transposase/recombinase [Actinobacteria bacterium]|nr:DDE-type integrase/transposase/recombinase [Actinomycetota bacterium]
MIGYALGRTLDTKLLLEVLNMIIGSRNSDDLIHHSDKGIQYCFHDYTNLIKSHNIKISMGAKRSPYDNAIIESFF